MKSAGLELIEEVLATAAVFMRESQRLFRPHGLTAAQFNVLGVLVVEGGGVRQQRLSELLVVDRSNITGLVDRLEKAGWVERQADPEDRRAHRVVVTETGRTLWETVRPRYEEVVAQVTAGMGEKRMGEMVARLRHLQAGAGGWRLPEA